MSSNAPLATAGARSGEPSAPSKATSAVAPQPLPEGYGTWFPHERLDAHRVLLAAYEAVMRWPGVAFSRGTAGDQLKRALGSALGRYAEGYYAQGGNQASLWSSARASCGESATAVLVLGLERRVSAAQAAEVRELLGRAMCMLSRLSRRS
ncbi:MAG: hypothetical protein HY744_30635 [Deltaproteobacteria bacterium]|nr:hypothetical protein [Deltaproteobacteria bacterium]